MVKFVKPGYWKSKGKFFRLLSYPYIGDISDERASGEMWEISTTVANR